MHPNKSIRKLLLLVFIVTVGLFGIFWVSTHGRLKIVVSGADQNTSYAVFASSGNRVSSTQGDGYNKTIRNGTYYVVVEGSKGTFVFSTSVGRFLKTSFKQVQLVPESERTYIGDNPFPCMYHLWGSFISGGCGSFISDFSVHTPATTSMPTYKEPFMPDSIGGYLSAVLYQKDGQPIILSRFEATEGGGEASYYLQKLPADKSTPPFDPVPFVDVNRDYSISRYGDGFVLYTQADRTIWYYPSFQKQPTKLILKTVPKDMSLIHIGVQDSVIVQLFGDYKPATEAKPDTQGTGKTTVVISQNNSEKQYTLKGHYKGGFVCGSELLCLLGANNTLYSYKLDGKKLILNTEIPDVLDTLSIGSRLYYVTASGLTDFDFTSQEGRLIYSFGSYRFCGTIQAPDGFYMCIMDKKDRRVALHIQQNQPVSYKIDRAVEKLSSVSGVDVISANGFYLYVIPKRVGVGDTQPYSSGPAGFIKIRLGVDSITKTLQLPDTYKIIVLGESGI